MKKYLCFLAWALGVGGAAAEPLDVAVPWTKSDDPLILQGAYLPPAQSSGPVLIALHGLGSSRDEWDPLIKAAQARGWGFFSYDARGHGASRATLSGQPVNHEERAVARRPDFWRGMTGDLARVVQVLETQRGVLPTQRILVGASLGANVCLVAAQEGVKSAGLVLLSPGMDYAGLQTETAMAAVDIPILLVSAKPDVYAHASADRLLGKAPTPGRAKWIALDAGTPRGAHGTQLFDKKLEIKILDWVGRMMKGTGQPPDKPKR